jgi:hypothetical protein
MKIARLIGALCAVALHPAALACGYCVEDKIAAVYDHALVARAISRQHQVVFFAIEGIIPPGEDSQRLLQASAQSVAGVERSSVRVSVESASLSAVLDPTRGSVENTERVLNQKLARRQWHASILRVIDNKSREPTAAGK